MSFRIIEKRDDNTTIAVLENNTENLRKNVSFSDKLSTRTICESNQYSKYLTKKEKGQINLLNKSKEKDIKFNFQDKQSNHLNKDIKIFQSNQKVNNTSQLPAIQSTKLSNVLPTSQTANNHHFLPTIQINNKICAQEAGQKYQKSNIETKSSLNTTGNNQTINKEFIEPTFSKEEKPEATKIEQTNKKLNIESTFSKETKQNGTEIEQTNKKLNTESTFSKETKQNGTEIEQTNKKLNSEQSSSTNIISTSNFSHSYTVCFY